MEEIVKKYTNGEVTIVWRPALCTHATYCFKELPEVFDPKKRPWVNPEGASTERIIKQIKRCPSGALSYFMNDEKETGKPQSGCEVEIEVITNGPLVVKGSVCVKCDAHKDEVKPEGAAFCRCGKSKNQPYCDGSHLDHPFEK